MAFLNRQFRAITEGICELYEIDSCKRDDCHLFALNQVNGLPGEIKWSFHCFSFVIYSGVFLFTGSFPARLQQQKLLKIIIRLRSFPLRAVRDYVYLVSSLCVLKGFDSAN